MADSLAPRRLKGILSLLPVDVTPYAYDEAEWNAKQISAMVPSTRRQRRRKRRESAQSDDLESAKTFTKAHTTPLYEHVRESDVAVLFLFDPYQPYSMELFQKLVSVCQLRDEKVSADGRKIHCLVITQCAESAVIDSLLLRSGALLLPCDEKFAIWKLAAGFSSCPAVAVVECTTGRKISDVHEDLAVAWNAAAHVREAWLLHLSTALTGLQQIQACTLFPGSCIVQ